MKEKYREILNLLSDYGISEAVTLKVNSIIKNLQRQIKIFHQVLKLQYHSENQNLLVNDVFPVQKSF